MKIQKNKFKKYLSVLLSVLMIATAIPMSIFATDIAADYLTGTDAVQTNTDAEEVYEGKCGDNVYWVLDENGTLTINGSGAMCEDGLEKFPWHNYRSKITSIIIEDGVTTIGQGAFAYCANLLSVEMPDNLISMGDGIFHECRNLTSIKIPNGVKTIGRYMFFSNYKLKEIEIGTDVEIIEDAAFQACISLEHLVIPHNIKNIESEAFNECENLNIHYLGSQTEWDDISKVPYYKVASIHFCTEISEINPDCISCGYSKGWYCDICETYSVGGNQIPALGHTYIDHAAKAPSCTAIGWDEYQTCKNCDYTSYKEIPATGHSHKATVTKATCICEGYTTYKCACGDSYVADKVTALGHSFTDYVSDNNATCVENGTMSDYCNNNCGAKDVKIIENSTTDHSDKNNDGSCDVCTEKLREDEEPVDNSFFGKIKAFFQRIIDWFKNLFK